MQVQDVMTETVHTVNLQKKTLVAAEIMNWANVRHVPVVNARNEVVGIITHRDLLRVSMSALDTSVVEFDKRRFVSQIPITEVMQREVRTISPGASVRLAARIMRQERVGCLPVVEKGKLVGIVTEADLLGVLETMP